MSWRFLFATLLIALGAAAWGGIQFGDWLVAHAPVAAPAPGQDEDGSQPVLDANGRPYTAQPPQPRVDGTLGVPDQAGAREWQVNTVSLFDTNSNPNVQISRDSISMDRAREIAANSDVPLPTGPSDVTTLDVQSQNPLSIPVPQIPSSGNQVQQNPPVALQNPPVSMPNRPGAAAWQGQLRAELAECAKQGFFDRPSCSWNARNKYCPPNRAWGTIEECPSRP